MRGVDEFPVADIDADVLNDGTYDITVWVSEMAGVKELTEQQIKDFMEENPGIVINATIEGVTELDSATQMITSVEDGADLFCFAQDQLARLVQAGALTKLGTKAAAEVTELNDSGAVAAATIGSDMWCYPMTSDNGYFMIYDSSVIPAEHLDSLEDIIADCEAAGRGFSMELETSAWYNVAFFFATGCHSNWTMSADGKSFESVDDDFNSDNGVIALKGMKKLLNSTAYKCSSSADDFSAAIPAAVVIVGTWGTSSAKAALGDNYACTDLPSFTVDGNSYHLGSFSGNKLVGIKPQTDPVKTAVLQKLALYLTNEKCQLARFDAVGWGPSNKAAQQSEAVAGDPALAALAAQSAYATPQGQIDGSWWDIAKVYATAAKEATTDEELKAAGVEMSYKVGTMIEIPRAALTADEIAKEADFFSFGTNDLTQMTFGFSRDDAGKFLGAYYDKKIYESDPFARLDQTGVGKLVSMAAKMGRETNPHIHLGICGEHGGDPTSVEFCHKVGLDYVSCSPFRVPIARLAAAQAAIKEM